MAGAASNTILLFFLLFLFLDHLCFIPYSVLHKHMEGKIKHKFETELNCMINFPKFWTSLRISVSRKLDEQKSNFLFQVISSILSF